MLIPKKEILRLYEYIDKQVKDLLKKERHWLRCHPCINEGNCCINSKSAAQVSEWAVIREAILGLNNVDMGLLRTNFYNQQDCVFRTDKKCLIHSVRPIVCRTVPYIVFGGSGCLFFLYPSPSCRNEEWLTVSVPMLEMDLKHKFFQKEFPTSNRQIHYLNGIKLHDHKVFERLASEKQNFLSEWLTEYFDKDTCLS